MPPGVDVLSDIPSNVTSLMSGTSMSTPVVTGLASLIWGINPDLSAEQVRSFILASTSATLFNLDDESFIIRDLIDYVVDPTPIVNADICVQLAQATIGNGRTPDAEYGTVSGLVYALTPDRSNYADIQIESLSLYNENGDLVSTIPLQDTAYYAEDDDTGDVSILNLHTYSALVEPGTYTLKAEVDGYEAQTHPLSVDENCVLRADFEFANASSSVPDEKDNMNVIHAIDELLVGVRYDPEHYGSDVGKWTDEAICDAIYGKLLWDEYQYADSSFLSTIGLEYSTSDDGYWHFDLELIQKITQDTLGRDFPSPTQSKSIFVSGNELLISPATGESTSLSVQSFTRQGNRIIAVGTAVHNYNAYSEFLGYFQAVLEENPSSVYGYTLLSLSNIKGNQSFGQITASASSELKEATVTHRAGNVIDGDLGTAWVEAVHGVGSGEWIKLETTDGSKVGVSAIEFSMGFQKNDPLLQKNGWPHKILIECEGGYRQEAEFYDYTDIVVLDQSVTTSWIKITILEASAGSEYDDTCISEIRLRGLDTTTYFERCLERNADQENPAWNTVYYDYIVQDKANADGPDDWEWVTYEFVYLNDDSIPELWITYQYWASGCRLVTIDDSSVNQELLGMGSLSYDERNNVFFHSGGKMDAYFDTVYQLENGDLTVIAEGQSEVKRSKDGSSYNTEYFWNDSNVTEKEYTQKLNELVNESTRKQTSSEQSVTYDYDGVLEYLSAIEIASD